MTDMRERLWNFWTMTKYGYDKTYWVFVVAASAAVLTQLFGIGGAVAVVFVFAFFYYVGRLHKRAVSRRRARKRAEK